MKTIVFGMTAAMLLAGVGTVAAQGAHAGHGAGPAEHACPMHAAKAQGPAAALQHRDHLGLSSDQVQRLEALQQRGQQAEQQGQAQMQEIHRQVAAATEGARFDEQAASAAVQRAGQLHADKMLAALRARHETAAILTAPQRERLAHHAGHHGAHAGGGSCSMMGGGHQPGQGHGGHRHE